MGKHGKPDWGFQIKKTIYTSDDLGELAVRLGSIVTFDRRGDVLFLEDFENGSGKYYISSGGTGAAGVINSDYARNGENSLKLTAAEDGSFDVQYLNYIAYPVLSLMGLEIAFSLESSTPEIRFVIILFDGTTAHKAEIKYTKSSGALYYLDSSNVFQLIAAGIDLLQYKRYFNIIKLVADFENNKYERVILNDIVYVIDDKDMYSYASASASQFRGAVILVSRSGKNDAGYIDNVIVTQNEP